MVFENGKTRLDEYPIIFVKFMELGWHKEYKNLSANTCNEIWGMLTEKEKARNSNLKLVQVSNFPMNFHVIDKETQEIVCKFRM